jgi:hypothetical protein
MYIKTTLMTLYVTDLFAVLIGHVAVVVIA